MFLEFENKRIKKFLNYRLHTPNFEHFPEVLLFVYVNILKFGKLGTGIQLNQLQNNLIFLNSRYS